MTVSAATIDAYLRTGRTPRAIADWFGIPMTQVLSRQEIMARRKAEQARRAIERQLEQEARRKEAPEKLDGIDARLALDIRYEDDPRSKPFDYGRAFANTVRIYGNRPQQSSYGGGVSDIYESERGFDFHASRRNAA